MGNAKAQRMNKAAIGNQAGAGDNPSIQTFRVTVTFADKAEEILDDVVNFGPIPNQDLLGITRFGGQTTVYPLTGNIRKYEFCAVK